MVKQSYAIVTDFGYDTSAPSGNSRRWMALHVTIPLLRKAPKSVFKKFFQTQGPLIWSKIAARKKGVTGKLQELQLMDLALDYQFISLICERCTVKEDLELYGIEYKKVIGTSVAHVKKVDGRALNRSLDSAYIRVHQAALECLTRMLILTQTQSKFLTALCLNENLKKSEVLWANLVDTTTLLKLTLETEFSASGSWAAAAAAAAQAKKTAGTVPKAVLLSEAYMSIDDTVAQSQLLQAVETKAATSLSVEDEQDAVVELVNCICGQLDRDHPANECFGVPGTLVIENMNRIFGSFNKLADVLATVGDGNIYIALFKAKNVEDYGDVE
jgi:hypothetical protein